MKNSIRIFISYAIQDFELAKKTYDILKGEGLNPWMDKEDIVIGQDWEWAINTAIKECSYFLILISAYSLSKKGYIQKEQKIALDLLDEFPQSHIYILPARLENCIPLNEKFQKLQWVDLFPSYDDGITKIVKSLKKNVSVTRKIQTVISTSGFCSSLLSFILGSLSMCLIFIISKTIQVNRAISIVWWNQNIHDREIFPSENIIFLWDYDIITFLIMIFIIYNIRDRINRSVSFIVYYALGTSAGITLMLYIVEKENNPIVIAFPIWFLMVFISSFIISKFR